MMARRGPWFKWGGVSGAVCAGVVRRRCGRGGCGRPAEARALLDRYQQKRAERMRAEYSDARARGETPGWWQFYRERPLPVIAALIVIAMLLYLSVRLVLDLAGP